jgi:hypothetical protein
MAVFGYHNYGTPFGALAPSGFFNSEGEGFYNYSGFSSRDGRSGLSGFSGFSGFSAFCGPDGLTFLPWQPTLTFPLNYQFLTGIVNITWQSPEIPEPCGSRTTFEVQFTRTFSRGSGWKTLSLDVPSSVRSIPFDVSAVPFTEDGGIRIRAKTELGLYSQWSTTIVPFTIANHPPGKPSLVSPLGGETVDNSLPVVWREAKPRDVDGQVVTYRIQVTPSFSTGLGWITVPGGNALAEGTAAFFIDTFDFPEGDDYGVRVVAVDSLGAESEPAQVGDMSVHHPGSFVIDTIAPEGSVLINDGDTLAGDYRVKLSLFASDATTGIKDFRVKNADEDCWSDFDTFVPEKFWDLSRTDGVKRILVQFRDFAGNVSEACDCEIVSHVLSLEGNATDVEVFNNKLYAAFDLHGNLVEYRVLVRLANQFSEPQVTALAKLGNYLYVAARNPDTSVSSIYKFDGVAVLVASISGSGNVLSMVAYNDTLYMGLEDGRILSLVNTTLATVNLGVLASSAAKTRLRTDGAFLYVTERNKGEYLVFNGSTWQGRPV